MDPKENLWREARQHKWRYWGNILLGGVIGWFIVDPITGAMFEFDKEFVQASLPRRDGSVPNTLEIAQNAASKLRELKLLLEEDVISKKEYENEKKSLIMSFIRSVTKISIYS